MSVDRQPTLFDNLRASNLVAAGHLDELAGLPEARDPDPRALGRVLLQRRLLSKFQINLLAQGRGKDLRVGPYLLLDKLGEGGMGLVFKARHQHMSRVVALKVIRKEKLASADAVTRFYQEVEAAAQLHHPNIVLAFDAGQAGSTHFFAMEYIEGNDLARQVKEHGPLPEAVACEYVRQAALGLQHAFDKGLVHRDIKPHNLLVTTSAGKQVVKILDMGLARLQGQGESTALTQAGQVLGTPDYLAPEQAVNSRSADIRSDLYSLGCSLYFLLTGRPPFSGESLAQVLLQHQMAEVPPLATLRPGLSPGLQAVVGKMMAKVPEQRFQQPAEVAAALEPFARGEGAALTVPVLPPLVKDDTSETWATLGGGDDGIVKAPRRNSRDATHVEPAESGRHRKPGRKKEKEERKKSKVGLYSVIGAAVTVPLVALVLGLILFGGKKEKTKPPVTQGDATNGQGTLGKPKPDEEAAPFVGVLDGEVLCFGGLAVSPDGRLGAFPTPTRTVRLYDLQTGHPLHTFSGMPGLLGSLAFSADGKRLLGTSDGKIFEWDVKTRQPAGVADRLGMFLTPDGRTAFSLEGNGEQFVAIVRDAATGRERGRFPAADNANLQMKFTADGARFAMVGFRKTVQLADLRTPADLRRITMNLPVYPTAVCPTAVERQVVIGYSDGSVRLLDINTLRILRSFRGRHEGKVCSLALSPDGGQLLTAGDDNLLRLWDVGRGEETGRFAGHTGAVRDVAFTPDGFRAVSCSHDRTLRVWDLDKPTSRPAPGERISPPPVVTPPAPAVAGMIRQFPARKGLLGMVAFSPDGRQAFAGHGFGVDLLDLSTGQVIRTFDTPGNGRVNVALSADGLRLLTGGQNARLWDTKTGQVVWQLIGHEGPVAGVALSSDGKWAATGGAGMRIENNKVIYTDSTIRLWEVATGKEIGRLKGHTATVDHMTFSPNGKRLFSSSTDRTWRTWDVEKRRQDEQIDAPFRPQFAFLPDGRQALVYPHPYPHISVWNVQQRKAVRTLIGHTWVKQVVVSADGKFAVSGGGAMRTDVGKAPEYLDCTVRLWDIPQGKELGKFMTPTLNYSVALSPDGTQVLTGDAQGVMRLWDLKKALGDEVPLLRGTAVAKPTPATPPTDTPSEKDERFQGHEGAVNAVAISPNGKHLLTGGEDKTVRLWDYKTGKELKQFGRFSNSVLSVGFSAAGRKAFACDVQTDARAWNVETGEQLWHHPFRHPGTSGAFLLPDGSGFVRTLGDCVQAHIPQGANSWGGLTSPRKFDGPLTGAGSADGRVVAFGDSLGVVRLLDGATFKKVVVMSYRHKGPVLALAFNPKGDRVVSAGSDKLIVIRSVRTWKVLLKIPAHAGDIYSLAYSPDGKMIVSGSKDRTVRVWSALEVKQIKEFTGLPEAVRQVTFDRDSKNVIACAGELRVLPLKQAAGKAAP